MKQSTLIWTILMVAGGAYILYQASQGHGRVFVREVPVEAKSSVKGSEETYEWTKYQVVPAKDKNQKDVKFNLSRTIGLWVAAFCTLAIFSFLYGDNPVYKFTESVFVGVSAGYAMVVAFWSEIIPNLFGKLFPLEAKEIFFLELKKEEMVPNLWYLVPLVMSVLLLLRLSPKGSWLARWPLAFFIGATAGIRLISYLEADFVGQIQNTIMPFIVFGPDGSWQIVESLKNTIIILGVVSCMVYFFFSIEHEGFVKYVSRLGVWFLMVTFGASFAYTVMGRIALLSGRLEFLFQDWLGIGS
ncbi:hypothetical protein [Gimesia panareensis]|uniref:hypothetical protein n=1 Tax=Gimesia panareensis TaxID=2527978 RepID=UPI0011878593|nr:hypothetical protein [Gimesia panareensis]QDU51570.1 hypothetical protein Pan110_39360 [Gimesia panareensis]